MISTAMRLISARHSPSFFLRQHILGGVRTLAIPRRWYTLPEAIDTLREQRKHDHWMFQASFHLNIDPRMEGHNLSGTVPVPHSFGSERTRRVLALTHDASLAEQAVQVGGAQRAGNLLYELRKRLIHIRGYDLVVACTDMKKDLLLSKTTVPRILSKFSMTPSPERKTLVKPDEFVQTVQNFVNYTMMHWSTDLHGNVTVPLGKVLLPTNHIVENCERLVQEFYRMRPRDFGTGPRGRPKNVGKYILGIRITMTEGKALPIDLSTVKFCEHFGQGPPPYYTENNMPYGVTFRETVDTTTTQARIEVLPNGHPVKPIVIKNPSTEQSLLFKAMHRKKTSL